MRRRTPPGWGWWRALPGSAVSRPSNASGQRAAGRGVPQNSRRAVVLVPPLREVAAVALALARWTADTDPALAYGHALR
ncbi:hypothetical protein VB636_18020, partial [Paracoccus sp. APAP_BH8]|uniref:hypothetical protein n=1 Tax=Paracoccus sp. APAP_BH8 TaxID=3110237 RepID=UPI002FD83BDA